MFRMCTTDQEEPLPVSSILPQPTELRRGTSQNSVTFSQQSVETLTPMFPSVHRLSMIPTIASNEPLELLALANEAIVARDALLSCKRIAELCKDMSTLWLREQVAQCLARAMLVFGDVFPYTSKLPPYETLLTEVGHDEHLIVAVMVHDTKVSEILAPNAFDVVLDGLDSYPITFFRSQPFSHCTKDLHAELVMLSNIESGQTLHLQDNRPLPGTSGNNSASRRNRYGSTYFARRLYEGIVVVVYFPKSARDANDFAVISFLDKLSRLFVF